jgi:hypothetical protein
MIQDIKPENTLKTLENLARECQQRNASLRRSIDGNGDYRCFSTPLQQTFCPYQEGMARIEYRDDKPPIPKHMEYYRCEYNGGGQDR